MKFIHVGSHAKAIIFSLAMAFLALNWSLDAQIPEQLITIEQKIEPSEIVVRGGVSEQPPMSTVTLTLAGPPAPVPVDLVLVLDKSRSVSLKTVKKIAKELIKHLSPQDSVGLVSFADSANLDSGLTQDRKMLESVIEGLTRGRETALGEALALANNELITNGRAEALKVIFLPTDGLSTLGQETLAQARRAAENNINIFPIGLSKNVKRSLLNIIAEITGGTFFDGFSDGVLEKMFKKLSRPVVARYISIVETLSPGINFEGSSENPPKGVHKTRRGTTILEWSHSILFTGEVWAAPFAVSASAPGTLAVNQEPSKISFIGPKGKRMAQIIPLTELMVKPTTTATQEQNTDEIADIKQKLDELEQKLVALEQRLNELVQKGETSETGALRQDLENLRAQLATLNELPGRFNELQSSLNTALQDLSIRLTELEKKLTEQPPAAQTGTSVTGVLASLTVLVFLVMAGFVAYEWLRRKPVLIFGSKATKPAAKASLPSIIKNIAKRPKSTKK